MSALERLQAWKLCIDMDDLPPLVHSHFNDLYLILLALLEELK